VYNKLIIKQELVH